LHNVSDICLPAEKRAKCVCQALFHCLACYWCVASMA